MSGLITVIVIAAIVVVLVRRRRNRKNERFAWKKDWPQAEVDAATRGLVKVGPTHTARVPIINSMFEDRTGTFGSTFYIYWDRPRGDGATDPTQPIGDKRNFTVTQAILFDVSRNLAGMDNRERTYLRIATLLNSAANGTEPAFRKWITALLWGDGKGVPDKWQFRYFQDNERSAPVATAIRQRNMSVEQTINEMQQYAASATHTTYTPILSELTEALTPSGLGSWLKSSELETSPFAKRSDYPLHIGSFPDGTPLNYSGDGSMVTIAPPGMGKTQCNVFPNLLQWPGPAVVLDISGDIYEHTAAWRARNVGPVYKFSPLEPDESHQYNPLTFVRKEPDFLWEDSRLLAEMMIVPSLSSDPFWENEARTVLTAAIAYVCYTNPPDQRPMRNVVDVLFGGEAWDKMILGLRMGIHVMTQHANSLSSMNEKTLSSVLQTARSSLGAWTGERVSRATASSDWTPSDLRGSKNPTIYIYIKPNEVESYLSLLRVFIGQHIRILTGGSVPPRDAPPILFMLDELPRLRNMPPIDEALNIGRKYGLRLWMFAQSIGQFKTSYENADGLLGSCAVRIFMNPGGADGAADRLSEELGYVEALHDGARKHLVEAVELAGPTYKDLQIVLTTGGKPVTVTKDFAYKSPELSERMALEFPSDRSRTYQADPAMRIPE